jgi:DNA topoisomerase-3
MNAGRVQTPTCAIVVDRENQIRTFVSEDFWEVVGTFGVSSGKYKGKWSRAKSAEGEGTESGDASRFFDQSQALALVQECTGKPVDSVHDDVTEGHQVPPRLFDLTTLQREANRRFKMPVKRVLDIAQRLYETHKMTTYPRTDSSALPEDYLDEVSRIIGALENSEWGRYAKQVTDAQWVRPNKRIFDNSKISDHFAIIPTGVMSDALDPDERRIYDLIVRRFLSAFFPDLEFRKTRRVTVVAGQSFRTNGKVVTHQGWRAVLQDVAEEGEPKEDDEAGLCAIQDGEMPVNNGVVAVGGKTTPPARFTEGTLLAAMETAGNQVEDAELRAAMQDKGLGTPATRAATIEKLLEDRDAKKPYLVREKNFLVPTPKAMKLIAFLRSCEAGFLASPQTTGEWEEKLNRMARGEYSRDAFMDEIKETTRHLIDLLRNEAAKAPKVEATVQTLVGKCPDGGGQGGAKPPPLNRLACMCPKCESVMASRDKLVECTSCDFKVWREAFGRKFKDAELDKLIYRGEIKTLNGFVSRNYGNVYSAGVKLDRVSGKMELVFKER